MFPPARNMPSTQLKFTARSKGSGWEQSALPNVIPGERMATTRFRQRKSKTEACFSLLFFLICFYTRHSPAKMRHSQDSFPAYSIDELSLRRH
jgi:hypothetical protein